MLWFLAILTLLDGVGAPASERLAVSGERDPVSPLPSRAQTGGMAPERDRLLALGLPEPVMGVVQEAQAPSTRVAWKQFSICLLGCACPIPGSGPLDSGYGYLMGLVAGSFS
eukprot:superscaffoldBa00003190_g16348